MKNFLLTLLGITFMLTLSSCLRSADSPTAAIETPPETPPITMTMAVTSPCTDSTNPTCPNYVAPPPDTPPPDAPSLSDILISQSERSDTLGRVANTGNNSRTQSTDSDDSISAVTDSGELIFHMVDGERVAVMVENSNADWMGDNAPPLFTDTYIFDETTFARQTLADYESGDDLYIVSGFWFRDATDFGVFAEGPPLVNNLTGLSKGASATFRGKVGGRYWQYPDGSTSVKSSISGNLNGNIVINAEIVGLANFNTEINGNIIIADSNISAINLTFSGTDNGRDGIFNSDSFLCASGCDDTDPEGVSRFGARFFGNAIDNGAVNSDGWPAGIIGTFGIEEFTDGTNAFDALGYFSAIHEDLCAPTVASNAEFCTKP